MIRAPKKRMAFTVEELAVLRNALEVHRSRVHKDFISLFDKGMTSEAKRQRKIELSIIDLTNRIDNINLDQSEPEAKDETTSENTSGTKPGKPYLSGSPIPSTEKLD